MIQYLYIDTDNVIRVRGLKDEVSGDYINDATIRATVYDSDGNPVADAQDLSLSYVSDTNGDYAGEIPNGVSLTAGSLYTVQVTISGSGYQTVYRLTRRAGYKGE